MKPGFDCHPQTLSAMRLPSPWRFFTPLSTPISNLSALWHIGLLCRNLVATKRHAGTRQNGYCSVQIWQGAVCLATIRQSQHKELVGCSVATHFSSCLLSTQSFSRRSFSPYHLRLETLTPTVFPHRGARWGSPTD